MGLFGRSSDLVDDGGLRRRVEELERRVAQLEWAARDAGRPTESAPMATAPGSEPSISAEVYHLVAEGKKVQAIKVLREQAGNLSLREAKNIVERLTP